MFTVTCINNTSGCTRPVLRKNLSSHLLSCKAMWPKLDNAWNNYLEVMTGKLWPKITGKPIMEKVMPKKWDLSGICIEST